MLVLSLKFPPASGDRDMCLSWSRSPSTSWFACFMYVVHLNMAALKDSGGQNGLYLLEAQMSWFLLCVEQCCYWCYKNTAFSLKANKIILKLNVHLCAHWPCLIKPVKAANVCDIWHNPVNSCQSSVTVGTKHEKYRHSSFWMNCKLSAQWPDCVKRGGDDMLSVGFQRYPSHPVLWVLREIRLKLGNTQGKTDDSCCWRKRPSEKATRLESAIEGMMPTLCLLLASLKDAENYVRMI